MNGVFVTSIPASPSWSRRLAAFSAATAIAVSVIYLPQSLLTTFATSLGVSAGAASIVATTVQGGYAVGILLLVPLADRLHPRRQITIQALLLAAALVATALLPTIAGVAIGFLVVGLVANIAQVLIPAANRMSPPNRRGHTTSTLVGALLIGIFGGRIVAGLLVATIGWRVLIILFAAAILAVLPFVRHALTEHPAVVGTHRSYAHLIGSTLALVRHNATLVQSSIMHLLAFAGFNAIWTVMVLHLTAAPLGWSVLAAGLFGLVGLAVGVVAPFGGRLIDHFGQLPVIAVALAVLILATVSLAIDSNIAVLLGVSVFVITLANQTIQAANQSRVLAAAQGHQAQANTMFMFFVFLGGTAGSLLGAAAFTTGGMSRVGELAAAFALLSGICWVVTARMATRSRARDLQPA
jgi:predicted MFS family arabinose efflux permease